jgi:hypothetical protein
MHLFLKKIYRKNPFPKIYRINQCEVLSKAVPFFKYNFYCLFTKKTACHRFDESTKHQLDKALIFDLSFIAGG